jgi:hypothetical protein
MNDLIICSKPFLYQNNFQDWHTPWAGHKFFARDLVNILQPKIIVELGTYKGTSLFSFIDGIQHYQTNTKIFGIDTWKEDSHSGVYEGDIIVDSILNTINTHYPNVEIKLIRSTFDDALSEFSDNSIDLLHIDGWHTYEAVSNDFNNWINKMTLDSVILFHDISVTGGIFGVKTFWEEIKQKYECTLEFDHSNGLGILFLSNKHFEKVKKFINTNEIIYLKENFKILNHELYASQYAIKELNDIHNSKYWKLKEQLKKLLFRK